MKVMLHSRSIVSFPRRSFREGGTRRYDDAIWRNYPNYTISFLTTREKKNRISYHRYTFQTSIIDLLFVRRTSSSHLYRSNSIDFQEIRESRDPTTTDPFVSHSNSFRMKYKSAKSHQSIETSK